MTTEKIAGRVGANVAKQLTEQTQSAKQGPSKFDQVRIDLQDKQLVLDGKLPDEVKAVPEQAVQQLQHDLRKRLQSGAVKRPEDLFKAELDQSGTRLADLNQKVSGIPKSPLADSLAPRLQSLDRQYAQSRDLMGKLSSLDSPRELLQVQMQMYQLTQNIELMSKVVEQVTSGVKTVLQTNV